MLPRFEDRKMETLMIIAVMGVLFQYWFITLPALAIYLIFRGLPILNREANKACDEIAEIHKEQKKCNEYRETPEGQEKHRIYIAAFDADHVRRKTEIKDIKGSFIIDTMAKRYLCWVAQQSYQDPDVCKARAELRKAEHAYIKSQETKS